MVTTSILQMRDDPEGQGHVDQANRMLQGDFSRRSGMASRSAGYLSIGVPPPLLNAGLGQSHLLWGRKAVMVFLYL